MRWTALLAALVLVAGCGGSGGEKPKSAGQQPTVEKPTGGSGEQPGKGEKPADNGSKPAENGGKSPENGGKSPENGGKKPENGGEKPSGEGQKPPENGEKPPRGYRSFWADVREGDWALYVTWERQLALKTVEKVEDKGDALKITLRQRYFRLDGTEIEPEEEKGRFKPVSEFTEKKESMATIQMIRGGLIKESKVTFPLMEGGEMLCIKHDSEIEGQPKQVIYCRAVHVGGTVFIRIAHTTYMVLLDWGDKKDKPDIEKWVDMSEEVRAYYSNWDRFFEEEPEKDEGVEPPEPPED